VKASRPSASVRRQKPKRVLSCRSSTAKPARGAPSRSTRKRQGARLSISASSPSGAGAIGASASAMRACFT
jgi:hypothetical protein